MKTISLRLIAMAFAIGIFASSCRNQDEINGPKPADHEQASDYAKLDASRTAFAKVLARAVANEDVRSFLKTEANKQFDLDYDVLFQMVKDKEIRSGVSFYNYLSTASGSQLEVAELVERLPLLTIFVPKFNHFSAHNWDVATQIPLVAVLNSDHNEKANSKMIAFDVDGNQVELDSKREPTVPVIVVKDNERVVSLSKNGRYSFNFKPRGELVFKNNNNSFYFVDDNFNKKKQNLKAARWDRLASFAQKVRDAYNLKVPSHRDYIYYNITTAGGQGVLDKSHSEYMTALTFYSKADYDHAINGDWGDGSFEFSIDFFYFNGTNSFSPVNKMVSVPHDGLKFDGTAAYQYRFPTPHEIYYWDMQKQGDTWKAVAQEWDPNTVTTVTTQLSSKFGSNFSVNAGETTKLGIGFGSTTEQGHTLTVQYQTTGSSDPLGSGLMDFTRPIIYKTDFLGYAYSHDISTGMLYISMEPRLVSQP